MIILDLIIHRVPPCICKEGFTYYTPAHNQIREQVSGGVFDITV